MMFSRGGNKRFGETQTSVVNMILRMKSWELKEKSTVQSVSLRWFTFLLHICAKKLSLFSEIPSLIRKWRLKLISRGPPEL